MKNMKTRKWIGYAAVVCLVIGTGRVLGQVPVRGGHANDANNQVNSGGYNSGPHFVNGAVNGQNNQIEEGNVGGLNEFQGRLPSGEDPNAFQGATQNLPSENLNRVWTAPNVTSGNFAVSNSNNNSNIASYYDVNRFANAPTGYVAIPGSGSYAPGIAAPPSPNDPRLGNLNDDMVIPPSLPGDGTQPGQQVSLTADQPMITTASPLYGFKQWYMDSSGNLVAGNGDNSLGGNSLMGSPAGPPATFGAGTGLSNARVDQIRAEVNSAANTQDNSNGGSDSNAPGANPSSTNPPGANFPGTNPPGANPTAPYNNGAPAGLTSPTPRPAGAQAVGNKPLSGIEPTGETPLPSGRVVAGMLVTPINGQSVSTGQSTRYGTSALVEPGKQSTQYLELQKRLAEYQAQLQNGNLTDEQAFNLNQKEQQTIKQINTPGGAGPGAFTGRGAVGVGGGATTKPTMPRNTSVPPVQINSLSEGMQSRGLGQILKDAEDLVRQGKYKEAMDQYNNAAVIVPNNPMILLGRADAELGANLYARAENDLREAFAADTALMMAKINLKDLIGPKRIDEIQADLQQVAEKDQSNETPVFLLAYVDYNTDQISKVAGRLELAERINGGKDPLIESLFQHWNLTSTTQPAAGK